jgi:hypothetical protein
MKKIGVSIALCFIAIISVALFQNCSGAGGAGSSDGTNGTSSSNWYYHFNCNGDPGCLSTNPTGSTYGDLNEGPVYAMCSGLLNFAQNFWNAPASNWCDHSPTGAATGSGGTNAPTFTSMSSQSGAPNISFPVIYGSFPGGFSGATASYCGRALQVTGGSTTYMTVKIPYMPTCKSPITITTAGGSVNSLPFTVLNNFRSVAATASGNIVVSGDYATIMNSPDGITWTPRSIGISVYASHPNLFAVNWNGSQFMVVGDWGYTLTSPDGNAWNTLHTTGANSMLGLVWSGSQYVSVGAGGIIQTSPDGGTWTNAASAPMGLYYGVAYNGVRYVTVGALIHASADGSTWVQQLAGDGYTRQAVAWNGSKFMVVGQAGKIFVSTDGLTWLETNYGGSFQLNAITAAGTQFVAVGNSGTIVTYGIGVLGFAVQSSGTTKHLYGVTWTGTQYIAVGQSNTIVTSPDGVAWTVRNVF